MAKSSVASQLAERLTKIIVMLNNGIHLDLKSLAGEFGVSKRTLDRDIERLSSCLPLQQNSQTKKFYLERHYLGQLRPQDIKNFAQLSGIAQLYPSLDISFLREILDSRASSIYSAKGSSSEDATLLTVFFEMFSTAIEKNQQVAFLYNNEIRIVEPYRLIHHHGSWYLAAVKEGLIRVYRISRMAISYQQHELQSFIPDPQIIQQLNNENSIWFGREKTKVVLIVSQEIALHFKQRLLFPEQEIIEELKDGSLLVSSRISHTMQLLPLVRYWIPHVKITDPGYLQGELEKELKEYWGS